MFSSEYFVLIFIILHNLTRLNEGYDQRYKELSGLGTSFLLKAKLKFEEYIPKNYGWISKNWLIEESVFGDEKNMIVTLITEEKEGIEIKVFRDFKTQNISLVCVQNECAQNVHLLDKNLKGLIPSIAQTVKTALLLGPYRMISCEATGNHVYIYLREWKYETATYNCGTLYLAPSLQDSGRTKCMEMRDSKNQPFKDERHYQVNLILCIKHTESLEKANVSMLTKGIYHRFNESITRYNELKADKEHGTTQLSITSLDSVTTVEIVNKRLYLEFVYDRKFGLKYTPSGLNECTIISSSVDEEFNYVASENYVKEFAKELYFPKIPVESHSKKLLIEIEHNVMVENVKYDLAVKTYLEPHVASRFSMESGRIGDFCVQMDLYSKFVSNQISSKFNLTEVRLMCLLETSTYLDEDALHRIISSYHQCFQDRKNKVILRLEISLENHLMSHVIHKLQADIHHIKDAIRHLLIDKLNVSFLRINWIKLNFFDSNMVAKAEIVDSFVTYFESKKGVSHRFNIKSSESGQIHTSTIDECLRLQAFKANLSYVITCGTERYLCLGIADGDPLPDENENGLDCMLYNNSHHSLTKLQAEVPMKVIEKSYSSLNGSRFNYSDIEFAVVEVKIGDDIRFDNPEKTKSNSNFAFYSIISILIIMIFFAFGSGYKLSQNRTHPLRDYVSLKILKSSI